MNETDDIPCVARRDARGFAWCTLCNWFCGPGLSVEVIELFLGTHLKEKHRLVLRQWVEADRVVEIPPL